MSLVLVQTFVQNVPQFSFLLVYRSKLWYLQTLNSLNAIDIPLRSNVISDEIGAPSPVLLFGVFELVATKSTCSWHSSSHLPVDVLLLGDGQVAFPQVLAFYESLRKACVSRDIRLLVLAVVFEKIWIEKLLLLILLLLPYVLDELLWWALHLLFFTERTDATEELFVKFLSCEAAQQGWENGSLGARPTWLQSIVCHWWPEGAFSRWSSHKTLRAKIKAFWHDSFEISQWIIWILSSILLQIQIYSIHLCIGCVSEISRLVTYSSVNLLSNFFVSQFLRSALYVHYVF